MYFGKEFNSFTCHPIFLNGKALEIVREWKYLGVTIVSGKEFSCSPRKCLAAFYRTSNTILNVIRKPSNKVMMKLLYSIAVPNLTYASDVIVFKDMHRLHVATNDAIRKIFGYDRWESVTDLRQSEGYSSITEIFAERRKTFETRLSSIGNSLIHSLANINFT